jgi:DNA polymerase-1
MPIKHETEEDRWVYNAEDCVRTIEIGEATDKIIHQLGLDAVNQFQQDMFYPVLQAMLRGVRVDTKVRGGFAVELQEEMSKRESYFRDILGHELNPRSNPQMLKLFYDDLGLPVQIKRGTGRPTLDDDALTKLSAKEPIIRPLLKAIAEYRSLSVFLSTFVRAPLDEDGRMRCSYNLCGAETYRLSSSENAFGSGANLQNIPKGVEAKEPEDLELPNIRLMYIPDPGYEFFDMDLDRADLQVVVWESDEEELKAALRLGVDMHLLNAYTLAERNLPPLEELVEGHPKYPDWRIPYKKERQLAKSFIHGTNYGGKPNTMSKAAGVTVHQADKFQKIYFSRYPGIKKWHERIQTEINLRRFVTNKFGYRRFYFDRPEGILPEALAWIPQSTVACVINRAWMNIHNNLQEVQVLLQVHDSLAGQIPLHLHDWALKRMREEARIVVPYSDPLIIPVGIKTSTSSWGDCH